MMEEEERRYRFDPLDRAVFLGFTAVQCVLLGVGILAAAVARTAGLPLAVVVAPLGLTAGLALVPVRRRPACEWLGDVAGAIVGDRHRGRLWLAPLPVAATTGGCPPPPCLAGLDVFDFPPDDAPTQPVGLVWDRGRRSMTALIPVRGVGLLLRPSLERDRLVAGWGRTLAEFAGHGTVTNLSWSTFAAPSDLAGHTGWVAATTADDPATPPGASYRKLLADAAGTVIGHHTVVTVTLAADAHGRRSPGGAERETHANSVVAAARAVIRGLRAAGLAPGPPLTGSDIAALVGHRADPARVRPAPEAGRLLERLTPAPGGPLAVERAWSTLRIDATVHRSYWIESWPGQPRPAEWVCDLLAPIDDAATATRAVTVYLLPEAPEASARRLQRELARHESDADTRDRRGRRTTAAHRRVHQAVLDREEELVAGDPMLRYCGLLTVSAPGFDELERDCRTVEQLARSCGLGLRVLYGRQDLAWAATLPLGLAPRALLAS